MGMTILWLFLTAVTAQPGPVTVAPDADLRPLSQVVSGLPRIVLINQRVQLGGDVEFKRIGVVRNYLWVQLQGPGRVRLRDAGTRYAWFNPPGPGSYAFLLVAQDAADQTQGYALRVNVIPPDRVRPDQVILNVDTVGDGFVTPGSGVYNARTAVSLTATGRANWIFDHWETAGGLSNNTTNPLSITPITNSKVRAVFRIEQMTGAVARQILILANQERRQARLRELVWNNQLGQAAANQARDMAGKGYLGHISSDGAKLGDRLNRVDYPYAGAAEDIGQGPFRAFDMFQYWMQNTEYRQNILNPVFTEAGMALAQSPEGLVYWTAVFARPKP